MACKEFYDLNHIQAYLSGSIIRYNGRPIYIQQCNTGVEKDEYILRYCDLASGRKAQPNMKICKYPSDAIDLTPVPLGLVNLDGGLVHVCRMPYRQWKIGVTPRNINITTLLVDTHDALAEAQSLPFSQSMEDTILGNFPALDTILDMGEPLGAFSRRFGIIGKDLAYRTRKKVGKIINGVPVLDDQFFYLKEILVEDLNAKRSDYQAAGRAA